MIKRHVLKLLVFLLICAVDANAAGEGGVVGTVKLTAAVPNLGGIVMLYNKKSPFPFAPQKYRRMPDHVELFNPDGRFMMRQVPAGEYYVEATVRTMIKAVGPPGPDDYFYLRQDQEKTPASITIEQDKTKDLGTISQFIPFQSMLDREHLTGCEGTITDAKGKPFSYAVVFAYASPEMNGIPIAVSEQSDNTGRYLLGVPNAGSYYVKALEMEMKPTAVEKSGFYGASEPQPVVFQTEKIIDGVDIQLNR